MKKKSNGIEYFNEFMDRIQEGIDIYASETGKDLRTTITKESYSECKKGVKSEKREYRWKRRIMRHLNHLVKLNLPVHISTWGVMDEEYTKHFAEVMVRVPRVVLFNKVLKWDYIEIFELGTCESHKSNSKLFVEDAEENGFIEDGYRPLKLHFNSDKLDHMYVDLPNLHEVENLLKGCKLWFDVFAPELSDKLVYVKDWSEDCKRRIEHYTEEM